MTGRQVFGHFPDGRPVESLTLQGGGLTAKLLTMGAIVQDLRLEGVAHPLVLGTPMLEPYFSSMQFFGAIVGRFANRIGGARFTLDGRDYRTNANQQNRHILHGGDDGTWRQLWTLHDQAQDRAELRLALDDGHMGFPGKLSIAVTCALRDKGTLEFDMRATTEAPTPCNLAHHGYFNLDGTADICDHSLQVAASQYLPVDAELIPTGEIAPVDNSRFDFREARLIGAGGIDHNLCLSTEEQPLRCVATLRGQSGVRMDIETNACGLQVYDGSHISGLPGLDGRIYHAHAGIALETQGWPDAPNQPGFPSAILRPGQTYRHRVRYCFSA
ncbi:galactose mutarotase [Aureimonas fodinaquatilis]|uniref:Aldose 1-epimerase n=1 Tax=Aureimonas fodinaquatilis TaxID=2565783 RepID=A0A5B0DTZ4_9HYPH|nr:aldose epimerase family protein [Aureimonas fodinaquatilis]KAA0969472.1 galactose mutarotase [Aureimonas fodinaquatilis]